MTESEDKGDVSSSEQTEIEDFDEEEANVEHEKMDADDEEDSTEAIPPKRRRGRRQRNDIEHAYIRWSDEQVTELFRCAATLDLPPNAAGWGQSTSCYNQLLEALRASPKAPTLWGPDINRLTTHKLRVKYEMSLRQVLCGTYKPEVDSSAETINSLKQAVKLVKDKQTALEKQDQTPQGRWETELRRLNDKWSNAEEVGHPEISARRLAIAKKAILSARRMTPFFDAKGRPMFPEIILWNDEKNQPEILSVSQARNSPHTANQFRESLRSANPNSSSAVVTARRRRSDKSPAGTALKKLRPDKETKKPITPPAKNDDDSQTDDEEEPRHMSAGHRRRVTLRAELKRLSVATAKPLEEKRTPRKIERAEGPGRRTITSHRGGHAGHSRSLPPAIHSASAPATATTSTAASSSASTAPTIPNTPETVETRSRNGDNNHGQNTPLMTGKLKLLETVDHCIGDGQGSECRCRLTRSELLLYGISITGNCPDCHHKLSYHS